MLFPYVSWYILRSSSDGNAVAGIPSDETEDWEIVDFEAPLHKEARGSTLSEKVFSWRFQFKLELTEGKFIPKESTEEMQHDTAASLHNDTVESQQQCRLFKLPPELRLRIYADVLSCPASRAVITWTSATTSQQKLPWTVLAVLQTCRRIYAEAETIFYSTNQIHLVNHHVAKGFLQTINAERRGAIKKVSFSAASSSSVLSMAHVLTSASRLQVLEIHRQQSIRYIDVRAWAVLAQQIKSELSKLRCLRQLEIITPALDAPSALETERMEKLKHVDDIIVGGVEVVHSC